MEEAIMLMTDALKRRVPLLVFNGGSHADAQHLAGELASYFLFNRPGLPVALGSNTSILAAWSNDHEFETCSAREVEAYRREGGVPLGNSSNVVEACEMARSVGMKIVALTGGGGGQLAALADILHDVPENRTPRAQKIHVDLYHYLCACVDAAFGGRRTAASH
jgi:D-sedoheptulose 7-phosphate isomerase